MTFSSALNTGIWWKVPKQNPDQVVPFPLSSSPHHLHLHSQFASAESTFASVTIDPTHHLLHLTLNYGNPLRICYPEEEYITHVTIALQNLASRSRAMLRDNHQEGPSLWCSRWVIPSWNNKTISEMDLTQRDLPPLPFLNWPVDPTWISRSTWSESPRPIPRGQSPGAVEVTGFPPRPFLPKHIYLSTTIPLRNRDEQLAFIRHCHYL